MKKILAFALFAGVAGAALAQTSISIGINQPGIYGRIRIGDVPPPALILPQPVIIQQRPVVYQQAPVYLYVPPAHQQNWRQYCGRYSACNQPVYFVRDEWVRERYEHEHPGWNNGRHRGQVKHAEGPGRGNKGKAKGHDKQRH
ncbi:MAG: hypothetical protein ABIQ06_05200 [Caldimonas sp.]